MDTFKDTSKNCDRVAKHSDAFLEVPLSPECQLAVLPRFWKG